MTDWSVFRRWLVANGLATEEYLKSFVKNCGNTGARRVMLESWNDRMRPRFREHAHRVCLGWEPMDPELETMGLASKGKLFSWARAFLYPRARLIPPEDIDLRKAAETLVLFRQTACSSFVDNPRHVKQFICSICDDSVTLDHSMDISDQREKLTRILEKAAIQYAKRMEKLERPRGRKGAARANSK